MDAFSGLNTPTSIHHYLVFQEAISDLEIADITITGSPPVTISNLEPAWYNPYTVYVTAVNNVGTAHSSFIMRFVNTDRTITATVPPTLSVPDQRVNEDTDFELDLTNYTTGTPPFTYERTLISGGPGRLTLPDWAARGGEGLSLTEAGLLDGHTPIVDGDVTENSIYYG